MFLNLPGDSCLTVDEEGTETGIKNKIILTSCEESEEQTWTWKGHALTLTSNPNLCLTQISQRDKTTQELSYYAKLVSCSEVDFRVQTWEFISY